MLPRVRALRGGPCHSCLRDGGLDCKVLRVLLTGVWWPHTSPVTGKFLLTSEFTFDCVVTKRADFCSLQVFIALAATHTGHARVCCVRAVMDNSHQPEPESQGLKPLNEYTLSESSTGAKCSFTTPTEPESCAPWLRHATGTVLLCGAAGPLVRYWLPPQLPNLTLLEQTFLPFKVC